MSGQLKERLHVAEEPARTGIPGEPREKAALLFGGFVLYPDRERIDVDGEQIALHSRAFRLLVFLVENRERVVTRQEIFDGVWGGVTVADNNLSVQLSNLRRVIREYGGDPRWIVNHPGIGYRFVGDVTLSSGKSADVMPFITVPNNHVPDTETPPEPQIHHAPASRCVGMVSIAALVCLSIVGGFFAFGNFNLSSKS